MVVHGSPGGVSPVDRSVSSPQNRIGDRPSGRDRPARLVVDQHDVGRAEALAHPAEAVTEQQARGAAAALAVLTAQAGSP